MRRIYLLAYLLLTSGGAVAQTQAGPQRPAGGHRKPVAPPPIVLAPRTLTPTSWDASQLWGRRPLVRDSITRSPRLIRYGHDEELSVLYRLSRADTVWYELKPELPRYQCSEAYQGVMPCPEIPWNDSHWEPSVTFEKAAWGAAQRPVVLMKVRLSMGGNACSSDYEAIQVLELTAQPRLLLSALIRCQDECRGGTDYEGNEYQGTYDASWREVKLQANGLRIGRQLWGDDSGTHTHSKDVRGPRLTPLTPGLYKYQGGQLVRVGQ